MRALRSRRRALTAPQSSWHSEVGNDNAYDTPGDGLRIHVTTLVALNEGTWVSTSAIKSSDLLFGCRQQSRRGGYPAKILSSYRFNRRLPVANVVCICRLLQRSIREVFFRCRIHRAAGRRACRRSRPEVT